VITKKKIYIDCRLIEGSGIATYLINLIKTFNKIEKSLDIHILVKSFKKIIIDDQEKNEKHLFKSPIYSISEQLFFPKFIGKNDILHVPHYNAPILFSGKLIITVHDICHYVMKDYFTGITKRFYASIFMKFALMRANYIITVSHFTKTEIVKYFHINPSKITVIHNGIDSHYSPRRKSELLKILALYKVPNKYLLYVGNIKPHKNIVKLIIAYYNAKRIDNSIPKLIICGEHDKHFDILSELGRSGILTKDFFSENIILLGFVKYEDLPCLYSGAELFLYPSLYEGFGIPPLEAMACGTPVIASNTSSIPEILGENALLVNPHNQDDITDAIIRLWQNPSLQKELTLKGLVHANHFKWNESAYKHIELYNKLEK